MCIAVFAIYPNILRQILLLRGYETYSEILKTFCEGRQFAAILAAYQRAVHVTMVVDVGGTDGIDPCRNIADTPQSKYIPTILGTEIKGGARRPAEPGIEPSGRGANCCGVVARRDASPHPCPPHCSQNFNFAKSRLLWAGECAIIITNDTL